MLKMGQEEMRRRCLLGRLGGVAESVWMFVPLAPHFRESAAHFTNYIGYSLSLRPDYPRPQRLVSDERCRHLKLPLL